MKRLQITAFLVCTILAMAGCLENTGSDPIEVVEPSGSADYYINNQSSENLNVTYRILGNSSDSLKAILQDSSTKIYRDASFGSNPSPATSFGKIVFYIGEPDTARPALTIDPVEDDAWSITKEKGFEDSKYGFRVYEVVITNEDVQ